MNSKHNHEIILSLHEALGVIMLQIERKSFGIVITVGKSNQESFCESAFNMQCVYQIILVLRRSILYIVLSIVE